MEAQGCSDFLSAHYAEEDNGNLPDNINEETGKQATLLDYVSRFIISLFY